jgi:flagellin
MALSVLNNIASLTAQNELAVTNNNLQNTLFQLSSGSRINSGADDPAGLSIADGLQANITALTQSAQNATNGVGQLQVADGALSQVTTLLNRAVTLATEAANGGLTSDQYGSITNEYGSILSEINRIGNATNFNGNAVFSATNTANPNQLVTMANSALGTNSVLTSGKTTTVELGNGTEYAYTAGQNASTLVSTNGVTAATTVAVGQTLTLANGVNFGTSATYTADPLTASGSLTGLTAASTINTNDTMTITNATGGTASFTGVTTVGAALQMLDNNAVGITATLDGTGKLQIASTTGIATLSTSGASFAGDFGTVTEGTTDTVGDLMNQINANSNTKNITASLQNGKLQLTSTNGDIAATTNTMAAFNGLNATNTIQDLINGINASGLGVTASLQSVNNTNELVGGSTVTGVTGITDGDTLTITSGTQNAVTGNYPNTFTYEAYTSSSGHYDPVTGTEGTDTVQGLIDSINDSGTGFHAFINSNSKLEITDSTYSGNVSATGSVSTATGNFTVPSAVTQLAITDPLNRGDLEVSNNDTTFGYVAVNASGNPLEGANTNSFTNPAMAGSSGANVFISDGDVTNPTYNTISVAVGKLSTTQIGTNTTSLQNADLSSSTGASAALTVINNAISDVASMRGVIGAGINRLNSATNVINTQVQNLTSAQSSLQDANVGQVVASLSKYQILEQTGISSLAQANQNQQAILKLLQ